MKPFLQLRRAASDRGICLMISVNGGDLWEAGEAGAGGVARRKKGPQNTPFSMYGDCSEKDCFCLENHPCATGIGMAKGSHRLAWRPKGTDSICHTSVSLAVRSGGGSSTRFCSNGVVAITAGDVDGSVAPVRIAGDALRFSISMASSPAGTATSSHIPANEMQPGAER